ncbi:MAG: spore germination protein, partial [Firmicutes bacterium]|nr:spore germination protein [Bacillota bacterium]
KELEKGKSFDVIEREICIGGRDATFFFVDGLTEASKMQWVLSFLMDIDEMRMRKVVNSEDFLKYALPYHDVILETSLPNVMKYLYSGMVPVMVKGLDKVVILDSRDYPSRGVDEPSKEKSLRGAKDGFTEGFMTNIALVRRRIRDSRLVFENHTIGTESKTDAAIVYMKGVADERIVSILGRKLDRIETGSLGALDQTLVESILRSGMESESNSNDSAARKIRMKLKHLMAWLNPFPKVRYTERPDVVAAHVEEGKIAVILDNTPTVILLPACIFDFFQDVDDYYFPPLTGNYFRLLRIMNIFLTIFAVPVYFMMAEEYIPVYSGIGFFVPDTDFAVSLFWQFIIIEIAIDALKLASLNTPESLGMSLSVIGALILGEFSVNSGWFIPQTILIMAVTALASFTHPSIELGYAVKFSRITVLIGAALGGMLGDTIMTGAGISSITEAGITVTSGTFAIAGSFIATVIIFIVMATTKTLVGTPYLYPLVPFEWKKLKKLIFRTAE